MLIFHISVRIALRPGNKWNSHTSCAWMFVKHQSIEDKVSGNRCILYCHLNGTWYPTWVAPYSFLILSVCQTISVLVLDLQIHVKFSLYTCVLNFDLATCLQRLKMVYRKLFHIVPCLSVIMSCREFVALSGDYPPPILWERATALEKANSSFCANELKERFGSGTRAVYINIRFFPWTTSLMSYRNVGCYWISLQGLYWPLSHVWFL